MKNIPIYISTCDKTKYVLKPAFLLLEKYWNFDKTVKVLCYNNSDISVPNEQYQIISMREMQKSVDDWAKDILSVLSKETSEYVIFLLDDMLQLDYFNHDVFNFVFKYVQQNKKIGRYCLGKDTSLLPHDIIQNVNNWQFIKKRQNALYKNSTQPSLWKTDYLKLVLSKSTNPWDFEVNHNNLATNYIVVGTKKMYAINSLIETAISALHPGKFNILGLKTEDVCMLIRENIVETKNMQYGMRRGKMPQFNDYCLNFTLDCLRSFNDANGHNMYKVMHPRYFDIYEK